MAAIQVYKTDTFEIQRQKINQIGDLLSNFSGGGNDFAAGNLKLGDGTIPEPSLAFTSDPKLGVYKSFPKTLGIVSDDKKVVEFSDLGSSFFKNLNITQKSLLNSEIRIDNRGTSYDPGNYTNVPLLGGTGDGGSTNVEVVEFIGEITSEGLDYFPGEYVNIPVVGGTGENAAVSFDVDGLDGVIFGGSGYTFGAYEGKSLTGGSGSGAIADILVNPSGEISTLIIRNPGTGYRNNDILSVNPVDVGGTGSGFTYTITTNPGLLKNFQFTSRGSGYEINDILTLRSAITGLSATLTSGSTSVSLSSVAGIELNDRVEVVSGSGVLRFNTRVSNINEQTNTITLSTAPTASGSVVLKISPPFGDPSQAFEYIIQNVGQVVSFNINQGGSGYEKNDILTIDPKSLVKPILYDVEVIELQKLEFVENISEGSLSVGDFISYEDNSAVIYKIITSGGFINSIYIDNLNIFEESTVNYTIGISLFSATVSTSLTLNGFSFTEENGETSTLFQDITFIPGNTYIFSYLNFTSDEHILSFSKYPGGEWGRSLIQNVSTTLDVNSTLLTVSSTSEIVEGMVVSVSSGTGELISNTKVLSVDSPTTITIDKNPLASGEAVLTFKGVEYNSGVRRDSFSVTIQVTEDTPEFLYYYCPYHPNMGGFSNEEGLITTDLLNPRTEFGSGFQSTIAEISPNNIIIADPENGSIITDSITSQSSNIGTTTASNITADFIETNEIVVSSILSTDDSSDISLTANQFLIESTFLIGNNFSVLESSGNLETSGNLKSSSLNINDFLNINDNTISTTSGNNLILSPAPLRTTKVNSTTALVIPVGTNNQRPQSGIVETGAIRFNTDTEQYEGYSATSQSWSSLGGVRDVDGNTYIIAEASVGSNDNTLYFYNNTFNTLRLSETFFDFRSVKTIRSENMSAPAYTNWRANTPVNIGDYLKYKNNIYEVVIAGTTAGSANPPIHTTGIATNGSATLLWSALSIAPLTFEEVEEVRIGPDGTTPLVVSDELVLLGSEISSKLNDLTVKPSVGKKVTIDSSSSIVIPVGDNNQRGNAIAGSIRFNTDISQYEGYDGSNWSSLGGVRDVDGNTYIIPETSAGSNENILYFYNDGSNTAQLSVSGLDFVSTDNLTSSQTDTLNLNVGTVTFDSLGLSINNTGNSSVISSTKDSIDFNLSIGLTVDNLISLTDSGQILVNKEFGDGTESKIQLLDSTLKDFELDDQKISTVDIDLEKDFIDAGSTILYTPSFERAGRMTVVVDNTTQNEREVIDFNVCHKGTDIFYSEYGNITTLNKLISVIFDFTASNEVRANFSLNNNNVSGDTVKIVVLKTSIKK